jgi:predicted RNase H-like nuclease (RuvC/YqgF family)
MTMTTNQKVIVAIILGILVASLYIRRELSRKQRETVQTQEVIIDSLKTSIDSMAIVNKELEEQLLDIQYKTAALNLLIEENEQQISNLKKRKHEKATAVSKYSSNELIEFLSKRYSSDQTDSTSTK